MGRNSPHNKGQQETNSEHHKKEVNGIKDKINGEY
jgi:hypothetical protein